MAIVLLEPKTVLRSLEPDQFVRFLDILQNQYLKLKELEERIETLEEA